jgi:hypothetical protein
VNRQVDGVLQERLRNQVAHEFVDGGVAAVTPVVGGLHQVDALPPASDSRTGAMFRGDPVGDCKLLPNSAKEDSSPLGVIWLDASMRATPGSGIVTRVGGGVSGCIEGAAPGTSLAFPPFRFSTPSFMTFGPGSPDRCSLRVVSWLSLLVLSPVLVLRPGSATLCSSATG